jgi:hypothetical protein
VKAARTLVLACLLVLLAAGRAEPSLLRVGLLARRFGPVAVAGAAALCFVTIAENRLDADGGGALVVAAAFAVLAVAMAGVGARLLRPALAGGALTVFALLDALAAVAVGVAVVRGARSRRDAAAMLSLLAALAVSLAQRLGVVAPTMRPQE